MAKEQTDSSRYPSRHRPNAFVTAGQYVAELMCERKAQSEKKELPIRFWQEKKTKWYRYFCFQVTTAYKMIRNHGEKKTLEAIKANNKIYSLKPRWVQDYVENFKMKPCQQVNVKYNINKQATYQSRKSEKNIISKLEDLD